MNVSISIMGFDEALRGGASGGKKVLLNSPRVGAARALSLSSDRISVFYIGPF